MGEGERGSNRKAFEYLKASIADLFTLLSSSVQRDNFADPCQEFKQGFLGIFSGLPLV
jgi:hypothetical protein